MAFGKKKTKGASTEAPPEQEAPAADARRGRGRKQGTTLASVVNESAPGAAIDLLKRNEAFVLPGGKAFLGLLLNVDDIGGLSVKQKNDPAKGSIIELIKDDRIEVVVTADMLRDDFLGIVPTAETLDRMSEFSILLGARYYWVVFAASEDGSAIDVLPVDGAEATHALAAEVQSGAKGLADVVPAVWAHYGGAEQAAAPQQAAAAPEPAQAPEPAPQAPAEDPLADALPFSDAPAADDDPDGGIDYGALDEDDEDLPEPDDEDLPEDLDDDGFEPPVDDADDSPLFDDGEEDDEEDGYQAYVDANMSREVEEEEVRDTIARRFLGSDLDLSVDLAEFERVFDADPEPPRIEAFVADADDWLGNQVSQLAAQANSQLAQLRDANRNALRETYVDLAGIHAEATMTEVSTEREGSLFKTLMDTAQRDFDDRRQAGADELAKERRELQDRFNEARDAKAAQAAAHAKAVYTEKNQPELDRRLAAVAADIDRRHEAQLAHDRLTVQDMRRKEAGKRMEFGLTRIFQTLSQRHAEMLDEEQSLLADWNDRIMAFIDENRKNDVARAEALAEQLSRANAVEELKVEHANRVDELKAEAADRERRLGEEIVAIRQEGLDRLNAAQAQWDTSIALEQERTNSQRQLAQELGSQITLIKGEFEEQYRGRIAALEADKQSYSEELDRADKLQRRGNRIMAVLIVVLVLASLAVGTLLGHWWGFAQGSPSPDGLALVGSWIEPPSGP